MGADTFIVYQDGTDAMEAFEAAVEQAVHEHGREGFSGTIAEKDPHTDGLSVIRTPEEAVPLAEAEELAGDLLRGATVNGTVTDKYGPAGAIAVRGGQRRIRVTIPERPGGWASTREVAENADLPPGSVLCDSDGNPDRGPCIQGMYETDDRSGRVITGTLHIEVTGGQEHTGWVLFGNAAS